MPLEGKNRGRRGGDRIVVGFTTTCAISAYHHANTLTMLFPPLRKRV